MVLTWMVQVVVFVWLELLNRSGAGSVVVRGACLFECDSQILSQKLILHHTRDLWKQRAKYDNVGQILFTFFGRLFGHNSRFTNSFWLGLCVVRSLYHMQVCGAARHSRKCIRKNAGGTKVKPPAWLQDKL